MKKEFSLFFCLLLSCSSIWSQSILSLKPDGTTGKVVAICSSVTWNTQPGYDSDEYLVIPTNNDFDSIQIDVTDWILDMIALPIDNHGFLIRPSNEEHYRSMAFSSSDHEEERFWPELVIEYQTPEPAPCQFEFPNVFTPDGNGINDYFKLVTNCEEQVIVRMKIFNRWGEEVFRTDNGLSEWDGRIGGKMAPAEIYIYRAKVITEETEQVFEGNLTLIR